MKRRAVTVKDVARRAGVSPGTVSNVLRGEKAVRPATRDLVMSAVSDLNYRVNSAASYLRTGRSRIIGAIVPSLENPFFPTVLAAVERQCQADGYELIVASSAEDPEVETARVAALLQWKPAGFIVIPCSTDFPARRLIEAAHIPLVYADRAPDGVPSDFIEIDNVAAGTAAARHLVQLGHRRIAVCAPSLAVRNIQERIAGVSHVMAEFGARPVQVETGFGDVLDPLPERGEAQISGVTAIVALMNTTTLRVLAALHRIGRSIPDDVSLVGFDDYPWMPVARPSITAIRQPVGTLGKSAWARLRDRIGGADDAPHHRKLEVELILRDSTAPVRQSPLTQLPSAAVSRREPEMDAHEDQLPSRERDGISG
ncbi:MAG: LacI family transcriptional regulator [Hyphomicrobiales bacterium]|nr:MAG: LacI family transcriptional regulator [Hyphomicrobiales bacterium]